MIIYKIFRDPEWQSLARDGETEGAPIDREDGFIHLSTAEQVRETATRHFRSETGLWLAGLEADALGPDLRWEVSRGGQAFPHLYRILRRDDVVAITQLPLENGRHVFPPEIP